MVPELVFIHVPKAGGSSFTNVLRAVYGDDLVYYSWFEKDDEPIPFDKAVFAGHFPFWRTAELFPDTPKMTVLRNPINRVVSQFRFYRRSQFPLYNDWIEPLRRGEISLTKYAKIKSQRNVTTAYIGLECLPDLEFIGFTDFWNDSLSYFLDHYNNGKPVKYENYNVSGEPPITDPKIRKKIASYNERSMEVYRKALEMWGPKLGVSR